MTILAALDPTSFQTQTLAWLGVITVILGALSGPVALVISTINRWKAAAAIEAAKTKAEVASAAAALMNARVDRQGLKVESIQAQMTQVALATTPPNGNGETPSPTTVSKVEVVNENAIKTDDINN